MTTVYASRVNQTDHDGPLVAHWYPQPLLAPMPGQVLPPDEDTPPLGDFALTPHIRRQLDAPAEPWEPFATTTAAEHDAGCDGRTADAHAPDQHVARCPQCGQTVQATGGGL
jgi:hypothetical protein